MRVAFYAPMKPPDHPLPSGDRRIARAFMALLASLGHEVELASRFRSYDGGGNAGRQQRLERLGQRLASRLLRRYRRQPPELWFTYHLYHKAPDWLGPVVSCALSIPYVVAEASLARKQAAGSWAAGYAASLAAIAQADLVLAMTQRDAPGLAGVVSPERLRLFPPFLDAAPLVAASKLRSLQSDVAPRLLAVAMMRRDVKLLSYGLLADALRLLDDLPWRLDLVGDGEAREEISALFAPFGHRVRWLGVQSPMALHEIYAMADLYVWPACNEAYGMAFLEAQAAGVPVVAGREGGVPDIIADGSTGILVEPRSPPALAAAVRALLGDPARRRAMGVTAQARVLARHDLAPARARMIDALASIRALACASA